MIPEHQLSKANSVKPRLMVIIFPYISISSDKAIKTNIDIVAKVGEAALVVIGI